MVNSDLSDSDTSCLSYDSDPLLDGYSSDEIYVSSSHDYVACANPKPSYDALSRYSDSSLEADKFEIVLHVLDEKGRKGYIPACTYFGVTPNCHVVARINDKSDKNLKYFAIDGSPTNCVVILHSETSNLVLVINYDSNLYKNTESALQELSKKHISSVTQKSAEENIEPIKNYKCLIVTNKPENKAIKDIISLLSEKCESVKISEKIKHVDDQQSLDLPSQQNKIGTIFVNVKQQTVYYPRRADVDLETLKQEYNKLASLTKEVDVIGHSMRKITQKHYNLNFDTNKNIYFAPKTTLPSCFMKNKQSLIHNMRGYFSLDTGIVPDTILFNHEDPVLDDGEKSLAQYNEEIEYTIQLNDDEFPLTFNFPIKDYSKPRNKSNNFPGYRVVQIGPQTMSDIFTHAKKRMFNNKCFTIIESQHTPCLFPKGKEFQIINLSEYKDIEATSSSDENTSKDELPPTFVEDSTASCSYSGKLEHQK